MMATTRTYRRFALRTPTFNSELRRGLHPRNLLVALVVGLIAMLFTWTAGWGDSAWLAGLLMFVLVTLFHAAAHAYIGWRIQRGIHLLRIGERERAMHLLAIVRRPGMEHYDPRGTVRQVLDKIENSP